MARAFGRRGFTLLEVVIAAVLLGLVMFALLRSFKDNSAIEKQALSLNEVTQIEEDVTRTVMRKIVDSLTTACNATTLQTNLTTTLGSGIQLALVTSTPAGKLGPAASTAIQQRCLTRQFFAAPSNFANATGIYLCLSLTPVASAAAPAAPILTKQPLFVEAYFSLMQNTNGARVTCQNLAASSPPASATSAFLYYTFYWTEEEALFRTYNGTISMGTL